MGSQRGKQNKVEDRQERKTETDEDESGKKHEICSNSSFTVSGAQPSRSRIRFRYIGRKLCLEEVIRARK